LSLSSFATVYENIFIFVGEEDGAVATIFSWDCIACSEESYVYLFHFEIGTQIKFDLLLLEYSLRQTNLCLIEIGQLR
jgi:hypothetical protein